MFLTVLQYHEIDFQSSEMVLLYLRVERSVFEIFYYTFCQEFHIINAKLTVYC